MSRNLHMFPHNVQVADAKNVPPPRTREPLSPPHPSASTIRTMACSAFFSQIKTDRTMYSPAPPIIPLLDATPEVYSGAGSELVVTQGLAVYSASSAHLAPSALSCRQDTLSPVPTDVSHAASTRAWNSSTSHILPTSVLASCSTIEAEQPFSPSLHPLYLIDFRKRLSYTFQRITNRREPLPATPPAVGFPIPVPPSWLLSNPSCNTPSTYNGPSSTTSSATFTPNGAPPVSSNTISCTAPLPSSSLISTPPLPSQSRTTSMSSQYIFTSLLSLPSLTDVKTSARFATISHSSTRRYHGETTTSTIGAGVLSTNNPKGPDGFSRNTAAIVAVAVVCTVSIIIAVFAIFFACKRYKGRGTLGASSTGVLHSTPWHPPLAGDDDNQYYTDQHRGLVTASSRQHLESDTHSDEMTTYTGIEYPSPVRSITHVAGSSESGVLQPMRNISFAQQSSFSYAQAADIALPFPSTACIPSAPPPTAWPGRSADISDVYAPQHREASDGAPSLHAAASPHGHLAASSAGHGLLPAEDLSPGPSRFKDFIGLLHPGRSSLPNIAVHGSSSKSSSRDSVTWNNSPPPPTPFTARSNKPTLDSSDSLPRLPSPTATGNSRMFEDLLTPYLGVQRTSSEHSSLRDYVDYSRPISGLVRNRVYSTVTFQTEDTGLMMDGSI